MTSGEAGKHWHYKGDNKHVLWLFNDGNNGGVDGYDFTGNDYRYYLTFSDGAFTDSHVGSGSSLAGTNTPAIYLFENKLTAPPITYSVTWVVDGEVVQEDEVEAGVTPTYAGATPEKAEDEHCTYSFTGWDPEPVAVTGPTTYTAQFEATPKNHTVTFLDEGGETTIATETVPDGTAWANVDKPTATKDGHTFAGWDGAPTTVVADVSVTARYTLNTYLVTFVNYDGTELQSGQVAYGQTPAYDGDVPTRAWTEDKAYDFAGWDLDPAPVVEQATYTAQFDEFDRYHTVSFDANGGEGTMDAVQVEHGTEFKLPTCAFLRKGYHFTRWDQGVVGARVTVRADVTVKADWAQSTGKWVRIAGKNVYDTMKAISRTEGVFTKSKTNTVVIATRTNWEDPTAATALAGVYNAPLLFVGKARSGLPAQTKSELKRIKPKTVIVVGGTNIVSASTYKAIKKASGAKTMKRIKGKNYIERANGMLSSTSKWSGKKTAIIATHNSFRDSLAVSPVAYKQKFPIVYVGNKVSGTEGGKLQKSTLSLLKKKGIKRVIIVGSTIAVSGKVEGQLNGIGISNANIQRWYGDDPLDTSAVIAKNAMDQYGMTLKHLSVARCDGNNYADALAGSALTGRLNSVLLLANSKVDFEQGTKAFEAIKPRIPGNVVHAHVYGSNTAISNEFYDYFKQYI